jgi:hypothetical protein
VPFFDFFVRDEGGGASGEVDGEGLACVGVLDVEGADGGLDEGGVFLWPEEDLDRLPAYEAFSCKGWDGGGREVVGGRFEGVLAAG